MNENVLVDVASLFGQLAVATSQQIFAGPGHIHRCCLDSSQHKAHNEICRIDAFYDN